MSGTAKGHQASTSREHGGGGTNHHFDSLREQISPSQFSVVPLGRFRLKGKSEDRDLFQVQWSETASLPIKVAHTIITRPETIEAQLQRFTRDGVVSAEYAVTPEGVPWTA